MRQVNGQTNLTIQPSSLDRDRNNFPIWEHVSLRGFAKQSRCQYPGIVSSKTPRNDIFNDLPNQNFAILNNS